MQDCKIWFMVENQSCWNDCYKGYERKGMFALNEDFFENRNSSPSLRVAIRLSEEAFLKHGVRFGMKPLVPAVLFQAASPGAAGGFSDLPRFDFNGMLGPLPGRDFSMGVAFTIAFLRQRGDVPEDAISELLDCMDVLYR